ncbi:glycosyltransferase [Phyllobacterium zundukense]|uniref:Glycosyltransferase n=1 Tax=Phyllobacterium zundukense TaxID=1867719 RepID=A0ACD4CZH4_9HYPH|nr:glycosyltransferase [Phyllobacterium zundukense]UXN58948.1 glycosyltransferase [Phyllobacterium zundukense]
MSTDKYAVILVRGDIDRFKHNVLFAGELTAAFNRKQWRALTLDYILDSKAVFAALRDPLCSFFVTFNGFGTELEMPTIEPGRLAPAFEAFGKPVLDIMHDCPVHESMLHQLKSTYAARKLFITDYAYARMASDIGVKNVVFVPSITFPTAKRTFKSPTVKNIRILFAAGFSAPSYSRDRFDISTTKGRIYRDILDLITAKCGDNWALDPLTEVLNALADLDIFFAGSNPDHRFLLTTIIDYTKFDRRDKILSAIRDLPVTLVTDREINPAKLGSDMTVLPDRSATEILQLMANSSIVLSPTTHMAGFHERPLSAFTVGSAVVSAPCGPLQASFSHGKDILFFSDPTELRHSLQTLLSDNDYCNSIGQAGKLKASNLFSPDRLIETMLNSIRNLQ